jgi:hypothetical protein
MTLSFASAVKQKEKNKMPKTIAYLASATSTLGKLQTACNFDEGQLGGQLITLQLARIDSSQGQNATAAEYERVQIPTNIKIGQLIFVQLSPGQNPVQIINTQGAAGNRHLFDGEAILGGQRINVMVFRPV